MPSRAALRVTLFRLSAAADPEGAPRDHLAEAISGWLSDLAGQGG